MVVRISRAVVANIRQAAHASPGVEVCGLLLGDGVTIQKAQACRNVAADPARYFEIDPAALIAAHKAERAGGPKIMGCYHSHPSGRAEPSATDVAMAADNGWIWAIVAATEINWFIANGRLSPVAVDIISLA